MIIRDNFSYFSMNPYVVIPHLIRLVETVHIILGVITCFLPELTKIIPNYYQILPRALQTQIYKI